MDTTNCIAQIVIDGFATVRVVRIAPNEVITCDRNCSCLEESRNGSIQCSIGWIKKMVNFQTTALVIDYEIIMDRRSQNDWCVSAYDFPIIDESGQIHQGEFICDDIVSPDRLSDGNSKLYRGTKATFRVYYESFPKDGKIASIIAENTSSLSGRVDLLSTEPEPQIVEEQPQPAAFIPQQKDDLRERVEALENEVASLRRLVRALTEVRATKQLDIDDPRRPMSDPGIGYHPLDNK